MSARNVVLMAEKPCKNKSFLQKTAPDRLHKHVLDHFVTEAGDSIANLTLAYRVFGRPNPARDNIVLVFHALTGDANCAGYRGPDGSVAGWWEELFQPGGALDTAKFCVICPNHPLSCYGSSGPISFAVGANEPLGSDFPPFSSRDLARVHGELLRALGIETLFCAIGGSLGGMVALEWALLQPLPTKRCAVLAAPAAGSAQAIAFNHIQKRCFDLDPHFKGGRYYGGPKPKLALSLARQVAMVTYRSPAEFSERFGRETAFSLEKDDRYFEMQSYLDHQGEKLLLRFDPNCYLKLLNVLNEHDIARNRPDLLEMIRKIRTEMLFVGIDSDILYTAEEVERTCRLFSEHGASARYECLHSKYGHDGFLIEFERLGTILHKFLA